LLEKQGENRGAFHVPELTCDYLNFASCFACSRLRMNPQAKSGIRLKATNHPLGDKPASAELSFEPAISIAGEEGDNYRAKFRD